MTTEDETNSHIFIAGVVANVVTIVKKKFVHIPACTKVLIYTTAIMDLLLLSTLPKGVPGMWDPRSDSVETIQCRALNVSMYVGVLTIMFSIYVTIFYLNKRNVMEKVWTLFAVWIGAFCLAILQEFKGCKQLIDLVSIWNQDEEKNTILVQIILNVLLYIITVIVFFVLYIRIQQRLRSLHTLYITNSSVVIRARARWVQQQHRLAMEMLVWVASVTFVLWIPFHAFHLLKIYERFSETPADHFQKVVFMLKSLSILCIYSTTVFHPMIYALVSRRTRCNPQIPVVLRNRHQLTFNRRPRAVRGRLAFTERTRLPTTPEHAHVLYCTCTPRRSYAERTAINPINQTVRRRRGRTVTVEDPPHL